MAVDVLARDTNRPYPPASNVISVLQRVRSRNLPDRIDIEYLRDAGISESLIHRVAFALRFLGLVENDAPTPALRAISTSTDEEYEDVIADLLRNAYHEVFDVVDPTQDSQDRIVNVFRRYTPASQRERMVNFFLAMCREAGIATLDAPRPRASPVSNGAARPRVKAARSDALKRRGAGEPKQKGDGGGGAGIALPPALELLVRSLPPEGTPMSNARRKQWLAMADAALAFIYPEEEAGGAGAEDDENGDGDDMT